MRRQAKRRPMVNQAATADPRAPGSWGPADPLPAGRPREKGSIIEAWRAERIIHPMTAEAAYEIERCHRALVTGLWTKTAKYGEHIAGGPDTDWPARIAIAMRDRYGPWRDAMSVVYKRCGLPVHKVILDVVADGRSLREIDAEHRWRHGKAAIVIRWGLWEYARMAGWMRGERQNRGEGTKPRWGWRHAAAADAHEK